MKKIILILIMGMVLLGGCIKDKENSQTNVITEDMFGTSEVGVGYELKILEEFKEKEWVGVTVTLNDASNLSYDESKTSEEKTKIYKERKRINLEFQSKFISSLSESEFKIGYTSNSGRGFGGKITKRGFEILQNDPYVLMIYKPITGSVHV